MAKLIKKNKCKFIDGYIVKKSKQIGIPYNVWYQLNKIETIVEQYLYLLKQPPYQAGPSLEGFQRRSIKDVDLPYVDLPDTPTIDARVKEAIQFMEEADSVTNANEINEAIEEYQPLIKWLDSDQFFEGDCCNIIDLYELGNPLELKSDDIVRIITMIVESPIRIED